MSKEYYYTKNKDGFMGSENRKVRKKKSETCEEQLRRMVRDIANEITSGKTERLSDYDSKCEVILEAERFMKDVYDIRYLVRSDRSFLGAELLVAGGGPTIWVDTFREKVTGWWGSDRVEWYYQDNIGLNDYLEEMYGY
tara:strand:- start:132 stop:548 length:417 start_codon:yes stop_codon:yes gene_type:complete